MSHTLASVKKGSLGVFYLDADRDLERDLK